MFSTRCLAYSASLLSWYCCVDAQIKAHYFRRPFSILGSAVSSLQKQQRWGKNKECLIKLAKHSAQQLTIILQLGVHNNWWHTSVSSNLDWSTYRRRPDHCVFKIKCTNSCLCWLICSAKTLRRKIHEHPQSRWQPKSFKNIRKMGFAFLACLVYVQDM